MGSSRIFCIKKCSFCPKMRNYRNSIGNKKLGGMYRIKKSAEHPVDLIHPVKKVISDNVYFSWRLFKTTAAKITSPRTTCCM